MNGRTMKHLSGAGRLCLWAGLLALAMTIAGCCTCKVDSNGFMILIVHQPDKTLPSQINPEGALLGFDRKLENGDKITLVNRAGAKVTATFPDGIIEGATKLELDNCEKRDVVISFVGDPPQVFSVVFEMLPGHGGATIIVDPG